MNNRTRPSGGFLLVAGGAALWGTDAIFRRGLALDLAAPVLVFLEHAVLVLMTLPVLWIKRDQLRNLGRGDWVAALVIGAGSSAVATILFTSAFRYGDPTTPLLLQKLQPLVAVIGARLLLGERLLPRFAWFLLGGLAGAYLVAFPDPAGVTVSALTPALFAVGAASLWGLGTVLGRRLAPKIPFSLLTALRFAIGLPAAGLIVAVMGETGSVAAVSGTDLQGVVALAFVPGLIALLLYYNGLRSTPASAATLAELAFPLTATGLNYVVFGTVLTGTQWIGVTLL
ncbi:MAG: DMT family transporter, partial [Acidimicrobiia bacterium]|nr:DMT family transporter [Acidimicrobiia bacterium]